MMDVVDVFLGPVILCTVQVVQLCSVSSIKCCGMETEANAEPTRITYYFSFTNLRTHHVDDIEKENSSIHHHHFSLMATTKFHKMI